MRHRSFDWALLVSGTLVGFLAIVGDMVEPDSLSIRFQASSPAPGGSLSACQTLNASRFYADISPRRLTVWPLKETLAVHLPMHRPLRCVTRDSRQRSATRALQERYSKNIVTPAHYAKRPTDLSSHETAMIPSGPDFKRYPTTLDVPGKALLASFFPTRKVE
jgi:hypothetical protein